MAINFTFPIPNTTDFLGAVNYFNSLTDVGQGGMFFTIMLIVFGGIMFMMMKNYGAEKALGFTGIMVAVIAWLFRILSWVNDITVTICTILGAIGLILIIKGASDYES